MRKKFVFVSPFLIWEGIEDTSLTLNFRSHLGQSNNSDTCAEFRIRYVGAIEKLKLSEGKGLDGPLDLINYIDVAQVKTKMVPVYKIRESKLVALEKDVLVPEPGYITVTVLPTRWLVTEVQVSRTMVAWNTRRSFSLAGLFTFSGANGPPCFSEAGGVAAGDMHSLSVERSADLPGAPRD